MEQLVYEDKWFDGLLAECKPIWFDFQQSTFKRYREIGKLIIKSGYLKGQWHSKEKTTFIEEMKLSRQTFSRMVILGEMNNEEFAHTVSRFKSLHEWINQSKTIKEDFMIEKRLDVDTFKTIKDAKLWFSKMGGKLDGCYWIGKIDKRILESVKNE